VSVIPDSARVCPRCGAPAEAHDFCSACGLRLQSLPELPTRGEWEADLARSSNPRPAAPAVPTTIAPAAAVSSIKPLLHPTERSRLVLAVVAGALAAALVLVVLVAAGAAGVLVPLVVAVGFVLGTIWISQQLLRARLLGRSIRVTDETFPELEALLNEVRDILQYHRRVDVYVVDKASSPIGMSSYLGTRIIVIEGGLVAELLAPAQRPQLVFLIGRSLGALRAKHARLDIVVLLLQMADALKFVSLFISPWYRATAYSGDQIGMMCCSDLFAALEATRRLLVGRELAAELQPGQVLPQALLVQHRLLPRFVQLLSAEPHITNRYANLICFGRYHDPAFWADLRAPMDAAQLAILDQMWQESPHRRRLGDGPTAGWIPTSTG